LLGLALLVDELQGCDLTHGVLEWNGNLRVAKRILPSCKTESEHEFFYA
jgi:hypothetical protein